MFVDLILDLIARRFEESDKAGVPDYSKKIEEKRIRMWKTIDLSFIKKVKDLPQTVNYEILPCDFNSFHSVYTTNENEEQINPTYFRWEGFNTVDKEDFDTQLKDRVGELQCEGWAVDMDSLKGIGA